jgi:hypothetical protein
VKKLVIIVALVMFLKPVFPVIDYIVNYDYISKELCENKAKPELECNGKCKLMQGLAKASDEDKPISSDKKVVHLETELLFFKEIETLIARQTYFQHKISISDNYSNLYFHLNGCAVFHPPTIIT